MASFNSFLYVYQRVPAGSPRFLSDLLCIPCPLCCKTEMDRKDENGQQIYIYIQGGAPPVISWFIIPLTMDISTISPSY